MRTLAAADTGGLPGHSASMSHSSGSARFARTASTPSSTRTIRRAGRRDTPPAATTGRPSTKTATRHPQPGGEAPPYQAGRFPRYRRAAVTAVRRRCGPAARRFEWSTCASCRTRRSVVRD
ncbi:hypothetical protein GCM10018963_67720 [Saccharothrix longispora]